MYFCAMCLKTFSTIVFSPTDNIVLFLFLIGECNGCDDDEPKNKNLIITQCNCKLQCLKICKQHDNVGIE